MVYHRIYVYIKFPMLYSRTLSFTHPVYKSLPLLTPKSHSIPLRPLLPLGNYKSDLCVCESVSVLSISSFVSYFRFYI